MDKYVKRGLSAYKIFLNNKLVASIMMLSSGIMMFIAAVNGKGNDTYSLPILITSLGTALTLWSTFKLGRTSTSKEKSRTKEIIMQVIETLVYMAVAGVGVFLLSNQEFTNKALNIMAGFFTCLNGVFGVIYICKNFQNKDFFWKFKIVLTVFELIIGLFFIIASDSIDISGYIVMGALTTVAGIIEVITATTKENIKGTLHDGKDIIYIMKNGKKEDVAEEESEKQLPEGKN